MERTRKKKIETEAHYYLHLTLANIIMPTWQSIQHEE